MPAERAEPRRRSARCLARGGGGLSRGRRRRAGTKQYEPGSGRPLLREMLDTDFESEDHRKFRANRSLRDVEPEVDLYLREPSGREVGQ